MPRTATVYKILIASPSDVGREREICKDVILDWNATNSNSTEVFLEPVLWETHVAFTLGDDPQQIINKQLLEECDFVIGMFWSRIGLPTKNAEGGAVEELNYFLKRRARTIVGFSQAPIPPANIDIDQISKLKIFREKCEKIGIVFTYNSMEEFRNVLTSQLSKSMNRILSRNEVEHFSQKNAPGKRSVYNVKDDHDRLLIQAHQNKTFDEECLHIALSRMPKNRTIRILDAGCGFGFVTYALFSNIPNSEVVGIDHSEEAINYASSNLKSDNIVFQCSDIHNYIEETRTEGNTFDIIFVSQLLHHVDNPESLMKNFWGCLSCGGVLLVRNSDDGFDINYPTSEGLDYLIDITNKMKGSSDRLYGRKIYTHMKRLNPAPVEIQMKYDHPSTVGKTPEERLDYFNCMHGFRINYAKKLAHCANAKPSDIALYEKLLDILSKEKDRFRCQEDLYGIEIQIMGIALK